MTRLLPRRARPRPARIGRRRGCLGVHAGLDWDWELPALALTALLLVARLASASER